LPAERELIGVLERDPIGKMIGEVLREIGLLIFTFMPLDAAFVRQPVPAKLFWSGLLIGLALIVGGVVLERIRK